MVAVWNTLVDKANKQRGGGTKIRRIEPVPFWVMYVLHPRQITPLDLDPCAALAALAAYIGLDWIGTMLLKYCVLALVALGRN